MLEALDHIKALRPFISSSQLSVMGDGCRGQERDFFFAKFRDYAERVTSMPKTYEQEGKGDETIVYLHYFTGSCDWYVIERDMESEQLQAFGLADLGYGGELGYLNITELIQHGVELDLHFTPTKLAEIRQDTAS